MSAESLAAYVVCLHIHLPSPTATTSAIDVWRPTSAAGHSSTITALVECHRYDEPVRKVYGREPARWKLVDLTCRRLTVDPLNPASFDHVMRDGLMEAVHHTTGRTANYAATETPSRLVISGYGLDIRDMHEHVQKTFASIRGRHYRHWSIAYSLATISDRVSAAHRFDQARLDLPEDMRPEDVSAGRLHPHFRLPQQEVLTAIEDAALCRNRAEIKDYHPWGKPADDCSSLSAISTLAQQCGSLAGQARGQLPLGNLLAGGAALWHAQHAEAVAEIARPTWETFFAKKKTS
ncbi:MAG: hypothetical protein GDA50_07455 [Alphaproteobacteria bacterium GM202ARS2]|nr:hypothetical protein [Alphaproteobacteria bacterium GM202ARS2]